MKIHVDAANPPAKGKLFGEVSPGIDSPSYKDDSNIPVKLAGPTPKISYRRNKFLRDLVEKRKSRSNRLSDIWKREITIVFALDTKPFEPPKQADFLDMGFSLPFYASASETTVKDLFSENKDRHILLKGLFRLLFKADKEKNRLTLILHTIGIPLSEAEGKIFEDYFFGYLPYDLPEDIRTRVENKLVEFYRPYGGQAFEVPIPANLMTVSKQIHRGSISSKDSQIIDTKEIGRARVWRGKNADYLVAVENLIKLGGKSPKIGVAAFKNLIVLFDMVRRQGIYRRTGEAKARFRIDDYGKYFSDKKSRLAGGKQFNEWKRNILTGHYTHYRIKVSGGTKYELPFYSLYLPDQQKKGFWEIEFVSKYAQPFLKIIQYENGGQFFNFLLGAVEDSKTSLREYLLWFYLEIVTWYDPKTGWSIHPRKINGFLENIGLSEKRIKSRRAECAEILKNCLVYVSSKFPRVLSGIYVYNDYQRTKTQRLPLSRLQELEGFSTDQFIRLIKGVGVSDFRDAYISFRSLGANSPPTLPRYNLEISRDDEKRIADILTWLRQWEEATVYPIKFPEKDRDRWLKKFVQRYGGAALDLLVAEYNGTKPNALEFLIYGVIPAVQAKETPK